MKSSSGNSAAGKVLRVNKVFQTFKYSKFQSLEVKATDSGKSTKPNSLVCPDCDGNETRDFDVKEETDLLDDSAFLHGDREKEEVDIFGDGEAEKVDIIDGEEIVLDQLDSIQNENMVAEDQDDIPVEVQKVTIHHHWD
ncbi:hypothetical protein GH714_041377 [Hevea brasiliensis]|uniref:Uncharacterized protein n=1 Tax=Hevea brasiliensis TaxID=3981 RepID=A0A6A6N0F9_HEVBR|nr:hypothetical protein GH714_041377 [Hevea brasiliensis]